MREHTSDIYPPPCYAVEPPLLLLFFLVCMYVRLGRPCMFFIFPPLKIASCSNFSCTVSIILHQMEYVINRLIDWIWKMTNVAADWKRTKDAVLLCSCYNKKYWYSQACACIAVCFGWLHAPLTNDNQHLAGTMRTALHQCAKENPQEVFMQGEWTHFVLYRF